jgi:nucleotide-binding universal stress UspA family protein
MLPIKKIICPTDFSEPAGLALTNAVELALHFGAELCVVHIVPEVPRPSWRLQFAENREYYEAELAKYEKDLHGGSERKLREILSGVASPGLKSRAIVGLGSNAADEIIRLADEEKADLIVIATHGFTGWRHVVFGSVAERVVRLATGPVLTVRAQAVRSPRAR